MTDRKLIIVFIVIFLLFTAIAFVLTNIQPDEDVAVISVNGKVTDTVDLNTDRTFTLSTDYGNNTVVVEDGNIKVSKADCPDGLCVRHGHLRSKYDSIVCLPNKLVIEYKTDGEFGAVTGR